MNGVPVRRYRWPALLLLFVALAGTHSAASAQSAAERITGFRVDIEIEPPNGNLLITETIDYDFGSNERHGIFRNIPVRFNYDDSNDRIYPLEVLSVTGSPGTPAQYELSSEGGNEVIRIGDPNETISGPHSYVITYRVEGALNGFDDHDELYWNAVGFDWNVDIANVDVTVAAPASVTQAVCFAGPEGSVLPCAQASTDGSRAHFVHPALPPFEAMTVVVGIPAGAVDPPAPILEERWSLGRAFRVTPFTVAGALTIAVLLGALLYQQIFKRARDRRFAGSVVDAAMGTGGAEEPVGLMERPVIPVEYLPPDNLRPGQVGTLVDETAHTIDVIATIVDLAVRGYLRIEEIPKEGWFGKPDWWLHKLKDDEGLKDYERRLFWGIFSGGQQEVMLSQLQDKFATKLKGVQDALYDGVVAEGWFKTRPDGVRQAWTTIGVLVLILGAGFLFLVAAYTEFGLVAIPFPLAGLLVLTNADRMPSRTAKGTALARRVNGFRKFVEESEADRARFAEEKNLFSEYLPYAIVFGATEKWARAFEGLEGEMPRTNWYVGTHPHGFTASSFSESMSGFTIATSGTITSTPASSGSSGFGGGGSSGGGGGGGGGGSW